MGDGGAVEAGACIPQCCCGRPDCAYLAHSCRVLEQVQNDARRAGELGQALLARHESYVADAERDRSRMMECMDHLEHEKTALEARNVDAIEENRKLLDQLELLNTAVIESDSKILSLTDALRSAEQNVEKLSALSARTERLQDEIMRFEQEQMQLQNVIATTKEDERTATLRWQQSERTMNDLQDQLDRIEREAREEGDRHADVVARMERRRAVEMELQSAAGRLKGAAAAKTIPQDGKSSVVSHFVKDILQDNANLQVGIVELKDMLDRSNEEVERLRQLIAQSEVSSSPPRASTPNLGAELGSKELHVHHHYHAPTQKTETPKLIRKEFPRRPRKKRISLTGLTATLPHTPKTSVSSVSSPTSSTILSHTAACVPSSRRTNRWSVQSSQTGYSSFSSLPSSPYGESVFDRVFSDNATDFSHPTSPESDAMRSPRDGTCAIPGKDSVPPFRLDQAMRTVSEGAVPLGRQLQHASKSKSPVTEFESWIGGQHSIIHEEIEEVSESTPATPAKGLAGHHTSPPRDIPRLRRAASHESIISISGVDIHTLQSRPSQLLIGKRVFSSTSPLASQPILSEASAVAMQSTRPSSSSINDSRSYLTSLAASQRRPAPPVSKKSTVGQMGSRLLGGWVTGRWGATPSPAPALASLSAQAPVPTPTTTTTTTSSPAALSTVQPETTPNLQPTSISSSGSAPTSKSTESSHSHKDMPSIFLRAPGVNQNGPIFGFGPQRQISKAVVSTAVDEAALLESLGQG